MLDKEIELETRRKPNRGSILVAQFCEAVLCQVGYLGIATL